MNAIIRAAIQRWQITLVVFLTLTALGLSAFLTIPRSVDPHFPSPFILIIATVPGAEPGQHTVDGVDRAPAVALVDRQDEHHGRKAMSLHYRKQARGLAEDPYQARVTAPLLSVSLT